jgi:hypothetical protein
MLPNVAFQVFVAIFNNCTAVPVGTIGAVSAAAPPLASMDTPDTDKTILVVPSFTIVIKVPRGKATDAFVGIVMVCAPVLAE